jgi:predicted nucleic acid-binding protein
MSRYLLDTSALIALRDNEAGADAVASLLYDSLHSVDTECFGCFISQMELLYRVWQDEGESAGRLAYEQCRALPIARVFPDQSLLEKAAEVKATLSLSLADAWIAATAISLDATLVHKDPEFEPVNCPQQRLPYK